MNPQWLPYLLIVWITLDITQIVLFVARISNLKKFHAAQLSVEKHNSFNDGWKEGRHSLPIVQHCNSRTNYEFIKHQWNPDTCKHCKEVQDILNES